MSVIKFVEVAKNLNIAEGQEYNLREIYVNPKHVVLMREDNNALKLLHENKLPGKLDKRQRFTRVVVQKGAAGQELVLVGAPELIEKKLFSEKQLIKG